MTRNELWRAALQISSRHNSQTSSPDFIPNSLEELGVTEHLRRFCLRRSARSGSGYFVFTPCGRSVNLVSLYGNSGAPHRALSTQRFLCPRTFLVDFCALCPRALPNPRILAGLSKPQPNSRAGSSTRSPGCCGWLCVFISILISNMMLGWSEGL